MTIKIRIKIGGVEVDYEGAEGFLDKKLPKLIGDVSALAKEAPTESGGSDKSRNQKVGTSGTLASFLRQKNPKSQQTRFLATAEWLHQKEQVKNMETNNVTKALKENQQKRLSNPSDCLNRNVKDGYCEKDGKGFYVTEEGREALDQQ